MGGEADFQLLSPTKINSGDSGERIFVESTNKSLFSVSSKILERLAKGKSPLLERDFIKRPELREIKQNKTTEITPKQMQGVFENPLKICLTFLNWFLNKKNLLKSGFIVLF